MLFSVSALTSVRESIYVDVSRLLFLISCRCQGDSRYRFASFQTWKCRSF